MVSRTLVQWVLEPGVEGLGAWRREICLALALRPQGVSPDAPGATRLTAGKLAMADRRFGPAIQHFSVAAEQDTSQGWLIKTEVGRPGRAFRAGLGLCG